jgi:uncharacterized caspase-like protein
MRKTLAALFAVLSFSFMVNPNTAWSDQGHGQKPRIALVVGNAAYSGDAALKNPVNDATDMAAALKKVGWDVSLATNVDRKSFNRAIVGFRDRLAANEGAQALFFFAGHGIQVEGENYLVPVKEEFESVDDIKLDSVSVKSIAEAIGEGKADISIVILDACRDNPFAKKLTRSLGGARGLSVLQKGGGTSGSVVMFSTSPGDVALDGSARNGLFTGALLKYVADDLKIEDLFKKVTAEVRQASSGKQSPWINASLSSDVYFISDDLRAAKAAESAKALSASEAAKQAELDKALAAQKASADNAQKEAAAAKAAAAAAQAQAAAAQAAIEAERNKPKGKVRIEASVQGKVFVGSDLLGEVGPGEPIVADSLSTGSQTFRFARPGAADETKDATITDKAYVTVAFGPAAAGQSTTMGPPGAIAADYRLMREAVQTWSFSNNDTAKPQASLDGGDPVDLPHTFEGVQAGSHIIRIADYLGDSKLYKGVEETITVQPGKRLEYSPDLVIGRAKLRVTDIPAGAALFVDGVEIETKAAGTNGTLSFEGTVDAGKQNIEVVKGNYNWHIVVSLGINEIYECSTNRLTLLYTLPSQTIRMKGKEEDWQSIEPIFQGFPLSPPANIPGSKITGGRICRDKKNLYIRMDFENGAPRFGKPCSRYINLGVLHIGLSTWDNGEFHADIYNTRTGSNDPIGSYHLCDTFLELKFPLSSLAKSVDLTKPISASLNLWIPATRSNYQTPSAFILIGE